MTAPFLQLLASTGHFVVGVYSGNELVGCSVGVRATDPDLHPRDQAVDRLHSDITGVLPKMQNQGIGFQVKRYQRQWAMDRGITRITWTFDPLLRRNAHFNLCKLGAEVDRYVPDYYGDMDDGINTGEITDRLLVTWPLEAERVKKAMEGDIQAARLAAVAQADQATRQGAALIDIPDDTAVGRRTGSSRRGSVLGDLWRRAPWSTRGKAQCEAIERDNRLRMRMRMDFTRLLEEGCTVVGVNSAGQYVLTPPPRETNRRAARAKVGRRR